MEKIPKYMQKILDKSKIEKPKSEIVKKKRVAILGTAGSLVETPWSDTDLEFWAPSPVLTHKPAVGKRMDLLFEFHPMEYWNTVIELLNNQKCKIMMQQKVPQIKNSETFPLKEIQEKFSWFAGKDFFTSTIAYMMAYAIYLEYEQIELYGVHMSAEEEYGHQLQAMDYWVGVANGKGIGVYIPKASDICHGAYLYGYEQESSIIAALKLRKQGLERGTEELQKRLEKLKDELAQNIGAVKDEAILLRRYGG